MTSTEETDVAKVAESFEEFKWPFDKGEADEEKLAKLIWNARRSEEAALEKARTAGDKVAEVQAELDTTKASKSGTDEEGQQKIKDLTTQVRDLEAAKAAVADGRPEDKLEIDRLTVALDLGLSARDAKRLVGKDKDELTEDAKAFAKEHGLSLAGDEDEEDEDEEDEDEDNAPPVRQPVSNLRTGAGAGRVKVASDTAAAAKSLPPLFPN